MFTDSIADEATVELDWFERGDLVSVTPRNQQRFEIHKDRAIRILQLNHEAGKQISLLLDKLALWLTRNTEKVHSAILTVRDERFLFLVISKVAEMDDDLEDSVSEIDFDVANDSDLEVLKMNAIVLPQASREALDSFVDRRFMMVYGGPRK